MTHGTKIKIYHLYLCTQYREGGGCGNTGELAGGRYRGFLHLMIS